MHSPLVKRDTISLMFLALSEAMHVKCMLWFESSRPSQAVQSPGCIFLRMGKRPHSRRLGRQALVSSGGVKAELRDIVGRVLDELGIR
jgi:hypothetical protein